MADLKTQIETAKKILERKRCTGIICSACPASKENSGSDCRNKFGYQTYYHFNDKALTWFENWLKENDVERNCNTCRFSPQNTSDTKAYCPVGLPECDERNNYYKWQPIPKEELKPPYVITDVPKDEEIFIKVCEKTRKQWNGYISNKRVFEIANFPCKIYVDDTLTHCKNSYKNEHENKYKFIYYKDFLNIKEEEVKMKQVVLEVPNKETYIDLQWFKNNGDCGAGEKYFINRYGKDAKIKWNAHYYDLKQENNTEGLKFMDNHRPEQPESDYAHIGNVNKDNYYILKIGHCLHKIAKLENKLTWSRIDENDECYPLANPTIKGLIEDTLNYSENNKIYEFDTFGDFIKAYQEGKI